MRVEVTLCPVLRHREAACGDGGSVAGSAAGARAGRAGGDGRGGTVEVAVGTTLAEVVDRLALPAELHVLGCVNGKAANGETRLSEGDDVYVFVPVSGG
jgi:sulfur carrier protein ThiS